MIRIGLKFLFAALSVFKVFKKIAEFLRWSCKVRMASERCHISKRGAL
jgi:hypothetical protein